MSFLLGLIIGVGLGWALYQLAEDHFAVKAANAGYVRR
jgi:hypothetical protein